MKKPVAALTSFMASEEDAAPARFSEQPEIKAAPVRKPPKPPAERNDAQIVLKVPESFEREFKSYAAANGKKLNQFVMQLFREHLKRERAGV
jgi:predicted HicB family RNase H-like nuclease